MDMSPTGDMSILFVKETDQIVHTGRDACKKHIEKRDGGHGFHHDNSSRNDDRVVTAFDPDTDIFAALVDCILFHGDGGRGLDGSPENDIAAVADAAQDAAGMIGYTFY